MVYLKLGGEPLHNFLHSLSRQRVASCESEGEREPVS